jgi:hypothetical protein
LEAAESGYASPGNDLEGYVSILLIILVVIVVLALLGYVGRGRY